MGVFGVQNYAEVLGTVEKYTLGRWSPIRSRPHMIMEASTNHHLEKATKDPSCRRWRGVLGGGGGGSVGGGWAYGGGRGGCLGVGVGWGGWGGGGHRCEAGGGARGSHQNNHKKNPTKHPQRPHRQPNTTRVTLTEAEGPGETTQRGCAGNGPNQGCSPARHPQDR